MTWIITLVMLLIKYGPEIYNLVKDIIAMIKELRTAGLDGAAMDSNLRAAIQRFKVTGDDSELMAMYAKLYSHLRSL